MYTVEGFGEYHDPPVDTEADQELVPISIPDAMDHLDQKIAHHERAERVCHRAASVSYASGIAINSVLLYNLAVESVHNMNEHVGNEFFASNMHIWMGANLLGFLGNSLKRGRIKFHDARVRMQAKREYLALSLDEC